MAEICRLTWFPPMESGKHLGDFFSWEEACKFLIDHPEFDPARVVARMCIPDDFVPSHYYTLLSERGVKGLVKCAVREMLEDLLANS